MFNSKSFKVPKDTGGGGRAGKRTWIATRVTQILTNTPLAEQSLPIS